MPHDDLIKGELQQQVMRILWRLKRASVEEVRSAIPKKRRSAYTTVQTVLNRLAERGLLAREKDGTMIYYSPRIDEAEYLTGSVKKALRSASPQARRATLANLVGNLDPAELEDIGDLARSLRDPKRATS